MRSPLPQAFLDRLERIFPPNYHMQTLRSFSAPKRVAFRLNPLKAPPAATLDELHALGFAPEPVAEVAGAYTLPPEAKRPLTETEAFRDGRIYIQNPSSMLAPLALDPRPDERILDLAAAPGGKTLMMAAMMDNRGEIAAVEPVKERFFRLRRNLQNGNAAIVTTFRKDGRGVGRACGPRFDRVLLDAPCSSEAKFRADDPHSYAYWSPRKIKESRKLQKRLILSAWESLTPGGRMLYSTCSFAPEENEEVVDFLLGKAPDARILPIETTLPASLEGFTAWEGKTFASDLALTRRIVPDETYDGFYL
ncbi:RsmB/NOP family class I SAM-dependent RNA methyltransferase, partial [Nitratifractor sp.]